MRYRVAPTNHMSTLWSVYDAEADFEEVAWFTTKRRAKAYAKARNAA